MIPSNDRASIIPSEHNKEATLYPSRDETRRSQRACGEKARPLAERVLADASSARHQAQTMRRMTRRTFLIRSGSREAQQHSE
jgi:hypothetical protein